MNGEFVNAFDYKLIYVFEVNDEKHKGLVKIGDATLHTNVGSIESFTPNCHELNQAALKRIKSYSNEIGIIPKLLHTELAVRTVKENGEIKLKAFRDHHVHAVLKNSGYKNVKIDTSTGKEWFAVDVELAKKAISAVKNNYTNLSNSDVVTVTPVIFRPEQEEAVKKTIKQFSKSNKMLWNAKMRFGKTLCALEVVKQMGFCRTIILTHRPVVNAGWYEDFGKIFRGSDLYIYGSKNHGYSVDQLLVSGKNFVYFASVQDLRGSTLVGGKFDKNNSVFDTVWDCVIVDEAHEGTTTALGEDTVKAIVKNNEHTKFLALSGTPFNILDGYDENSIYTWDYIMEQECKSEWDKNNFGDSNPYEELPELRIYTYNLGDVLKNKNYIAFEDKAFNFHEFFRTWTGDFERDHASMPENASVGDFVHEADVYSLLNLMTKSDESNNYPFSNDNYRDLFRHSLWMIPGVKEARALKRLMMKHPVFGNGAFDIVNVAGDGDEEEKYEEALAKVKTAINDAGENYTITLSCGKLTTGVTVREWTAVFMLSGTFSTSASNYLQTIFRVQSPCNKDGKLKTVSYVFDFAPDRTLKMISEAVSVSSKAGKRTGDDKRIMGKFLNYCPVIAISGSEMKEYSANRLLQQLKRAYADKVVRNGFDDSNLYSDELFKLEDVDIQRFDELKGIIGTSKAAPKAKDITVNEQGLTNEEYEEIERIKKKPKKELSPEELARLEELKEVKKLRNDAISILRGISIRMPLLIYGANIPYEDEITIDTFVDMVDDSSWEEFMPSGVTKTKFREFQKYYDEDVFIAAGRRIRNIAKEADTLPPVERVIKIASLFKYFKNPDKETVLTPWRVVNLHISNSIGGWDFFGENHSEDSALDEPRFVDQGIITQNVIMKKDVRVLEINSKTGLYPLYLTYSIFAAKCLRENSEFLSLERQNELWYETVNENVYVVCKTPMAKSITKRTLIGFSEKKINAHYFDDLINTMANKPQLFIDKISKEAYWKKGSKQMKFDAIVGNPPYDVEGDNSRKTPVYHLFYDTSFAISDVVSLITPGRFLFNNGQTPKNWNNKMLEDPHFKVVKYYSDSREVFDTVDIKGGVVISLRNAKEDYGEVGIFTEYEALNSILDKVRKCMSESLTDITIGAVPYQYTTTLKEEHPEYVDLCGDSFDLRTNALDNLFGKIFFETLDSNNKVLIYGLLNKNRSSLWVESKYIKGPVNLDKFKLLLPKANKSGKFGETFSEMIIAEPQNGHTQSFISMGSFDTRVEAENLEKYIKTKFCRCMLSIMRVTPDITPFKWKYVPIQDFSDKSDINWECSIKEIDKQLYAKYSLNETEIDFIESNVQPMV